LASEPYLALREVSVHYDTVRAIQRVSLVAQVGEIVALIGANGAGKTTTLRALTRLAPLSGGEIWFDGRRINSLRPDHVVALGISMVPEGRHVFGFMSVRDNLLMGAFRRRDRRGVDRDLERVCARFPRLGERLRQQAGTLSGGEQQMLAIGRALMARPQLLLLDEPSLGLAPQVVREIARAIRAINRDERVTLILVEQNSRLALQLSTRAYVLERGRVALEGPSAELLTNDDVRRLYLGA
jgi:branched-chain amino acid transport system ATP-binding protein